MSRGADHRWRAAVVVWLATAVPVVGRARPQREASDPRRTHATSTSPRRLRTRPARRVARVPRATRIAARPGARRLAPVRPVRGSEPLFAAPAMLLVSDHHGTAEIPALVARLARQAARGGRTVWLGLEIPRDEQPALDHYLASEGTSGDRAALLAGRFWTRAAQDGRSSVAMVAMIEQVRAARAAGEDVRVFAFDQESYTAARDAAMAERILAVRAAAPHDPFIVYAGNIHTRTTPGSPFDPADRDYRPMGFHLAQHERALRSLQVAYPGGTAWNTSGPADRGHVVTLPRRPSRGRAPFVALTDAPLDGGFAGELYTGPLHASPPAVAPSP